MSSSYYYHASRVKTTIPVPSLIAKAYLLAYPWASLFFLLRGYPYYTKLPCQLYKRCRPCHFHYITLSPFPTWPDLALYPTTWLIYLSQAYEQLGANPSRMPYWQDLIDSPPLLAASTLLTSSSQLVQYNSFPSLHSFDFLLPTQLLLGRAVELA